MNDTTSEHWPDIPDASTREDRDVLAAYGQTMLYVQRFESTLKFLLFLLRFVNTHSAAPLNEDDIDTIYDRSRRETLKRMLDEIRSWVDSRISVSMPKEAPDLFALMVQLRNRLAHSYIVEHAGLFKNQQAHAELIKELRWFAQLFSRMDKYWSKWIDLVMEVLGFSKEELERQYQETVTEFDEDALAALRNRVAAWELE